MALSAKVIYLIYQKNANEIVAKGAKNAVCYLIARAVERKDIKALAGMGIKKDIANAVIKKVEKEKQSKRGEI